MISYRLLRSRILQQHMAQIPWFGPNAYHPLGPVEIRRLVGAIDAEKGRVGTAEYSHFPAALERRPCSVAKKQSQGTAGIVTDLPTLEPRTVRGLLCGHALLHIDCGKLGIFIGARDGVGVRRE